MSMDEERVQRLFRLIDHSRDGLVSYDVRKLQVDVTDFLPSIRVLKDHNIRT